jgi:hypothetical protein
MAMRKKFSSQPVGSRNKSFVVNFCGSIAIAIFALLSTASVQRTIVSVIAITRWEKRNEA